MDYTLTSSTHIHIIHTIHTSIHPLPSSNTHMHMYMHHHHDHHTSGSSTIIHSSA